MSSHGAWNETTANVEDARHPSPHRARVSGATLGVGLLAAPVAWSLQLLFNAGFAEWACYPHDEPLATPAWTSLHFLLLVSSLATLAFSVAGGLVAWLAWKKTGQERPGSAHHLVASGDGRTRFMAMSGMLVSVLFAVAILLATLNLGVTGCG